jgi:hypothetical protein
VHPRQQSVHRRNHEKINSGCDKQEGNGLIDEIADIEHAATDAELESGEISLFAQDGANERRKQVFGESGNHRGKGRADHHTHCHINYVSAQDEFLEAI